MKINSDLHLYSFGSALNELNEDSDDTIKHSRIQSQMNKMRKI